MRHQQSSQAFNGADVPLPSVTAILQMKTLDEQFGLAPDNRGPIVDGNGVGLSSAGGYGEGMDYRWTGTVMWQGIEKKEVRARITATAFVGNP